MAENDFTSIAYSLIPAAVGALLGGRNRGTAAALGLASGVNEMSQARLATDKLNTDIAFRNQTQQNEYQRMQMEQQRIANEQEQMRMQASNYDRLNRVADEQIKNYALDRQKVQLDIDSANRTVEGQKALRDSLPPDQQKIFDATPNKQHFLEEHYKNKDWELRTKNAANTLTKLGLDPDTARMLGPTGTAHLMGSILEARSKPREPYAFIFDGNSGKAIKWNKQNGSFETIDTGGGKASVEDRMKTRKQMLEEWVKTNAIAAQMPDAQEQFNEWADSQAGQLQEAYLLRRISPQDYPGFKASVERRDQEATAGALAEMKKAYMNAGTKQSEEGFQKYAQSPEGQINLRKWKSSLNKQQRQAAPGQEIPVKMVATDSKQDGSNRPSLDDIFGK